MSADKINLLQGFTKSLKLTSIAANIALVKVLMTRVITFFAICIDLLGIITVAIFNTAGNIIYKLFIIIKSFLIDFFFFSFKIIIPSCFCNLIRRSVAFLHANYFISSSYNKGIFNKITIQFFLCQQRLKNFIAVTLT